MRSIEVDAEGELLDPLGYGEARCVGWVASGDQGRQGRVVAS